MRLVDRSPSPGEVASDRRTVRFQRARFHPAPSGSTGHDEDRGNPPDDRDEGTEEWCHHSVPPDRGQTNDPEGSSSNGVLSTTRDDAGAPIAALPLGVRSSATARHPVATSRPRAAALRSSHDPHPIYDVVSYPGGPGALTTGCSFLGHAPHHHTERCDVSTFYILLAIIIAYLAWRGRPRRSRRMLSPADLGEVLQRSRQQPRHASRTALPGESGDESLRRASGD